MAQERGDEKDIRDKVSLEFIQVNVQGTSESKGNRN